MKIFNITCYYTFLIITQKPHAHYLNLKRKIINNKIAIFSLPFKLNLIFFLDKNLNNKTKKSNNNENGKTY
jgi:hypothetical protein